MRFSWNSGATCARKANLERTANDLARAIEVFTLEYLLGGKTDSVPAPSLQR